MGLWKSKRNESWRSLYHRGGLGELPRLQTILESGVAVQIDHRTFPGQFSVWVFGESKQNEMSQIVVTRDFAHLQIPKLLSLGQILNHSLFFF